MNLLGKISDTFKVAFNFVINRNNSPSNKSKVVLKDSSVGTLQQAQTITNTYNQTRPRIDIQGYGGSGSGDDTYVDFGVKNDGSEAAIDVQVEFVADDFEGGKFNITNLSPNQPPRSLIYHYHNTDFYKREVKNPRIVFRYKSADGRSFVARRKITQARRASGVYDIHKPECLGAYFEN